MHVITSVTSVLRDLVDRRKNKSPYSEHIPNNICITKVRITTQLAFVERWRCVLSGPANRISHSWKLEQIQWETNLGESGHYKVLTDDTINSWAHRPLYLSSQANKCCPIEWIFCLLQINGILSLWPNFEGPGVQSLWVQRSAKCKQLLATGAVLMSLAQCQMQVQRQSWPRERPGPIDAFWFCNIHMRFILFGGGPCYYPGEPEVSYRWTGWVWEITSWSLRLQANYRSFQRYL